MPSSVQAFCDLMIVIIPAEILIKWACCAVIRTFCRSGEDKSHAVALFFNFSFSSEIDISFFSWFANSKSIVDSSGLIGLSSFVRAAATKVAAEITATATEPSSILFVASITVRTSDTVPIIARKDFIFDDKVLV